MLRKGCSSSALQVRTQPYGEKSSFSIKGLINNAASSTQTERREYTLAGTKVYRPPSPF